MAGSTSSLSLNSRVHKWFLLVVGIIPGLALSLSTHTGDLPYTVWTIFVFTFVLYVNENSKDFLQNMSGGYETEDHLGIEKKNLPEPFKKWG